jgi:hypothetical protein
MSFTQELKSQTHEAAQRMDADARATAERAELPSSLMGIPRLLQG